MPSRGRRSIPFGRTVPSPGIFGSKAAANTAISLSVASVAMMLTRYSPLTRLACPAAIQLSQCSPRHAGFAALELGGVEAERVFSRGHPVDLQDDLPRLSRRGNEPDDRELAESVRQDDLGPAVHVSVETFLRVSLEFARPRPAGDAVREPFDAELPFGGGGGTAAARPIGLLPGAGDARQKNKCEYRHAARDPILHSRTSFSTARWTSWLSEIPNSADRPITARSRRCRPSCPSAARPPADRRSPS